MISRSMSQQLSLTPARIAICIESSMLTLRMLTASHQIEVEIKKKKTSFSKLKTLASYNNKVQMESNVITKRAEELDRKEKDESENKKREQERKDKEKKEQEKKEQEKKDQERKKEQQKPKDEDESGSRKLK